MAKAERIAIFLPSLRGGGAERVMVNLANEFAGKGRAVDLILVKAEGPYLNEVSAPVNVVDLASERAVRSLAPLVRYLRRERPSVMLSAIVHTNLIAILARKIARTDTRLIVSERNSLSDPRLSKLVRFLMRWLYPCAEGVVAVSRGIASELAALGVPKSRIAAIPNPIDIDRIARLSAERPCHPWLAEGAPPLILAVGRLEHQKDYPTLLEAFATVRADRDVRLAILGEGSLRADLERHVRARGLVDSVLLAGFQANPFGWMAASSVYVLSSRHEGFPNSLIQAMACGTQVVSTNCPTGPDEILEGGKWGRLVPVGDAEALARSIIEALDAPLLRDMRMRLRDFRQARIVTEYERALGC